MHARAFLIAAFVAITATSAFADSNQLTTMRDRYAFNAYNVSAASELFDVTPVDVPQSRVSIKALLPRTQTAPHKRQR